MEEGEKLECDTEVWCLHPDSENWRAKIPFVIIYRATVPRGERSGSPGWWLLCDTRAGLAVYLKQVLLQFPGAVICVQPGALSRDKIWPQPPEVLIPLHTTALLLWNPPTAGNWIFPISNASFLLASRSLSYDPIPRFGAWQEASGLWVVLHVSVCTHTPTYSCDPRITFLKNCCNTVLKKKAKIHFFLFLPCSGSSSLQNEMLTSAFAFPSCCVLHWIRPEKQYHQAWSSIYQCSQDWFVTLPILGKWMSPSRSLPVQADLCFAHISHVM